jgi:transcriptional regulator with XRE-family HTH domain
MKIGERIKRRRVELEWSQRDLAEKMGYNHSTITRIETGKIDISQSRVVQFSEVLGVSIAYLMGWIDEVEDKKNDFIAEAVLRMRTDTTFMSVVESLYKLDNDKLVSINQMLNTLFK